MKHIMMSIHAKWLKQIASGEKKYEFRMGNVKNFEKGDVIWLYESKGKSELIGYQDEFGNFVNKENKSKYEYDFTSLERLYSGYGMQKVIAKCVVGNVFKRLQHNVYRYNDIEIVFNKDNFNSGSDNSIGFDNQPYAIEITEFEMLEKSMDISEFVGYSKYEKYFKGVNFGNKMNCSHCKFTRCLNSGFNMYQCMRGADRQEDCGPEDCPDIRLTRPPQSWCRVLDPSGKM